RRETLDLFRAESLMLITPDDAIEVFSVCADDPDPKVRREVARLAGNHWVWMRVEEPASAVDLMMKLSADPDPQVRYDAVYYGLSTVDSGREDVPKRMVEMLIEGLDPDLDSRLVWGLRGKDAATSDALLQHIELGSGQRALAAYELYERLLGRPAPVRPDGLPEVASLLGDWLWTVRLPGGAQAQQEVTIERAAEGSDALYVTVSGSRFPVAATAFQERELLFVFTGNLQGSQFHTTARLRDGRLVGSTHALTEGALLTWTGRRR
ncbi:MAG: HEAT repeat domain-containing protein, partial [Planctomycetota bacterium]